MRNTERYRSSHPFAEFRRLDLTCDPLPEGDAVLCRDCLVHLPYASIWGIFGNLVRSGIGTILMTTFIGDRTNIVIEPGDWRPLNFQCAPFFLPQPEAMILEGCTEENGAYADKALGVWPVQQLQDTRQSRRIPGE